MASRRPTPRRGSVLIAVLGVILLLSFLLSRFMEEAVADLEYEALFNPPTEARAFAYSALETSLAVIHEVALIDDGKLHAPEQGWGRPLDYAGLEPPQGWRVDVTIKDLSGKLPINSMNEKLLKRLFEELGFDFGESRELTASLLDWIDSDNRQRLNGAESRDYLERDPPYRAANRPLQSLDELRRVADFDERFFDPETGRPNEVFERLENAVTVLDSGPVNLNSAPPFVLTVLSEAYGWDADYLFDGLERPYLTSVPSSARSSATTATVGLLRITITVTRGAIPFRLTAVVEPETDGGSGGGSERGGDAPGERQSGDGAAPSGDAPGRDADDTRKTGAVDEQRPLQYPFRIRALTEHARGASKGEPARRSAVDTGGDNGFTWPGSGRPKPRQGTP